MSTVPIRMSFHGDTMASPFFGLLFRLADQSVTVIVHAPGLFGSDAAVIGAVVAVATSRTESPVPPSSTVPSAQPGAIRATPRTATAIQIPYLARIVLPP